MKKRVMFYCQSLLGIGHFIRSRELLFALRDFDVCFLYGGEIVPGFELPVWVEVVYLPALKSDSKFQQLYVVESQESLPEIQTRRKEALRAAFDRFSPDILLIELFPFGRRKFNFELLPLLAHTRATRPITKIVCSLRDILVRRPDQARYEDEVCALMNQYFDLLLIHADPKLQRLEETFDRVTGIDCPIRYTGYVAQPSHGKHATSFKPEQLAARNNESLEQSSKSGQAQSILSSKRVGNDPFILVSIGGGRVGHELITCVLEAETRLTIEPRIHILTGPHMPDEEFQRLRRQVACRSNISIQHHTTEFLNWLLRADLSISMAGYNTCMDILSAGVPALVWPFSEHENDEQILRARKLERLGYVSVLDPARLDPDYLASEISCRLNTPAPAPEIELDLQGAARTAEFLMSISTEESKNQ